MCGGRLGRRGTLAVPEPTLPLLEQGELAALRWVIVALLLVLALLVMMVVVWLVRGRPQIQLQRTA